MASKLEYLSFHLPKTGGTSLSEYFITKFGNDYFHYKKLELADRGSIYDLEDLTDHLPKDKRIIHGHFKHSQVRRLIKENDPKLILWLRHPVERVISHYYFIQKNIEKNEGHHHKDTVGKITLREFAERKGFRNQASSWLDGLAFHDFFFIGILENFNHDLEQLNELLGFKRTQTFEKNVNREFKNKFNISEEDIKHIEELNSLDMEFYNQVRFGEGNPNLVISKKVKAKFKICLASFPRSGNTFFRNLFYEVFGLKSSSFDYPDDDASVFDNFPVIKTHLQPQDIPEEHLESSFKILIVRDARDCMISNAHHRKNIVEPDSDFSKNLEEVIEARERSYFGGWSQNNEDWAAVADCIIRYEDLVADTRMVLIELAQRIGIENPNLDAIPSFEQLKHGSPKYGPRKKVEGEERKKELRKKFFRKGIWGQWRDELPTDLHERVWELHGVTMRKFGYTRKTVVPVNPWLNPKLRKLLINRGKDVETKLRIDLETTQANSVEKKAFLNVVHYTEDLIDQGWNIFTFINEQRIIEPLSDLKSIDSIKETPIITALLIKFKEFLNWKSRDQIHVQFGPSFRKSIYGFLQRTELGNTDSVQMLNGNKPVTILAENPPGDIFYPITDNAILHPTLINYKIDGSIPFVLIVISEFSDWQNASAYILKIRKNLDSNKLRFVGIMDFASDDAMNEFAVEQHMQIVSDISLTEFAHLLNSTNQLLAFNYSLWNQSCAALCHTPIVEHDNESKEINIHELATKSEELITNSDKHKESKLASRIRANQINPAQQAYDLFDHILEMTHGTKTE